MRVRVNKYIVLSFCLGAIAVAGALYAWAQPKVLYQWVKIHPDGSQTTGTTVATDEGRGFEGEPDESPGLVISKWSQDISLAYRNASGRELSISFGGDFKYHYQLSAWHVTAGKIWSTQLFENFLSIDEQVGNDETRLSYVKATNLVERSTYVNRSSTPWEGVDFQLTDGNFTVTRYREGRPVASAKDLPIDEANKWRDQWSTPADKDYFVVVRDTLKGWQREMAEEMHLPALENEGYASLKARYFHQRDPM